MARPVESAWWGDIVSRANSRDYNSLDFFQKKKIMGRNRVWLTKRS